VATISRLLITVGFLCKCAIEKRIYSAKKAHIFVRRLPIKNGGNGNGRKTAGKWQ